MRVTILISLFSFVSPLGLIAQATYPTKFSAQLPELPVVRDALAYIDDNFESQVSEWIHITQIAAPSGHEGERAAYIHAQMEQLGLEVTIDSIGNVIGRRRGTGGGETLVFAAHMDTVHPLGTDLTVTREAGRLHAPGVYDNSASVANMLAAARAIQSARRR